ncbi:hypothetical protein J6590_087425, partial [Homalodisca vitripennis]
PRTHYMTSPPTLIPTETFCIMNGWSGGSVLGVCGTRDAYCVIQMCLITQRDTLRHDLVTVTLAPE